MKLLYMIITLLFSVNLVAQEKSNAGLQKMESLYDFEETVNRASEKIEEMKLELFTEVDHTEGARKAGLEMPQAHLFIIGNPEVGTPLMNCNITMAIDLPQKLLVYEDKNGKVWIAYNDQEYLAERHNLDDCGKESIEKAGKALKKLAEAAAGK